MLWEIIKGFLIVFSSLSATLAIIMLLLRASWISKRITRKEILRIFPLSGQNILSQREQTKKLILSFLQQNSYAYEHIILARHVPGDIDVMNTDELNTKIYHTSDYMFNKVWMFDFMDKIVHALFYRNTYEKHSERIDGLIRQGCNKMAENNCGSAYQQSVVFDDKFICSMMIEHQAGGTLHAYFNVRTRRGAPIGSYNSKKYKVPFFEKHVTYVNMLNDMGVLS